MTTREALKAALVAIRDDVALHSAYADFLIDNGDPRGEYIRLQLATEDRNQPTNRLRELEQAAFDFRQKHEREWLGDLRPHTHPSSAEYPFGGIPADPTVSVTWRRGWIDSIRVGVLRDSIVAAIVACPLTRLLSGLTVVWNGYLRLGSTRSGYYDLQPLIDAGRFANVRHFEIGSAEAQRVGVGEQLHDVIGEIPRLESVRLYVDVFSQAKVFGGSYPHLHTFHLTYNNPRCRFYMLGYCTGLPNLRRLHLDTVSVMPERGELGSEREPITDGDLQSFFRSKHLNALEYFTFRNGEFADTGVEELLASGFINRLKGLDLCRCNITDDGAQLLAAHPHVPKLEYLHLDGNLLSPIGVDALEAVGVAVSPNQLFADGEMAEQY